MRSDPRVGSLNAKIRRAPTRRRPPTFGQATHRLALSWRERSSPPVPSSQNATREEVTINAKRSARRFAQCENSTGSHSSSAAYVRASHPPTCSQLARAKQPPCTVEPERDPGGSYDKCEAIRASVRSMRKFDGLPLVVGRLRSGKPPTDLLSVGASEAAPLYRRARTRPGRKLR